MAICNETQTTSDQMGDLETFLSELTKRGVFAQVQGVSNCRNRYIQKSFIEYRVYEALAIKIKSLYNWVVGGVISTESLYLYCNWGQIIRLYFIIILFLYADSRTATSFENDFERYWVKKGALYFLSYTL